MTSSVVLPELAGAVLVASPSAELRDRVLQKIERRGPVHTASGGAEALAKLESGQWQMLFLDRRLPDLDAEELVEIIEQRYPGIRVVMVDSGSEDSDRLRGRHPAVSSRALTEADRDSAPLPGMIGDSPAMRRVYRLVRLVAPRNTTVLIIGPTGSGKELVARAIHQLSARSAHNFCVFNCAAIPEGLVESELFGHARGAFTGALQAYGGRILAAQGGTLFLDEIGELPLASQSKLLRFLEQREVQRVGSAENLRADVRVVAATNRDLAAAVAQGRFREDLLYRLSSFPIELPGLAQRESDLARLTSHFMEQFSPDHRLTLTDDARQALQRHSWPGNIRELQQVVERAVILAGSRNVISPEDLWLRTLPVQECKPQWQQ